MNLYFAIAVGAACGGFVQGFSGFAFGMTAMTFWAWTLEPTVAGPLVVLCSLLGQLIQLRPDTLRHADGIVWRFVGPALVAVPLGTLTLLILDPCLFRAGVGAVLVVAGVLSLWRRNVFQLPSARSRGDFLVGAAGGFLGGCCGLVGPVPALWCACKPSTDRLAMRNALQILFSVVHLFTTLIYLASGVVSGHTLALTAFAFVFMYVPARLGAALYGRINPERAQRAILMLLVTNGAVLLMFRY